MLHTRTIIALAASICPPVGATNAAAQAFSGTEAPAAMAAADSPAIADTWVLSAGAGYTSGWGGVELAHRRFFGRQMAAPVNLVIATGAGLAGVGSRVHLEYYSFGRDWFWSPYLSAGFAYTPWRRSSSGAWGSELGAQHWGADGGWFFDVGVGVVRVTDGEWFGRRTTPVLRLAVGRGIRP
jgi:hypothetical protein